MNAIHKKKVLVIDDSQLMHRMYEISLSTYTGHEVEAHYAFNGYEGLALLVIHSDADLIMLDVNMPTMSGLEFLAQVKVKPGVCDIPVILQTSEDSEADLRRGFEAGARGYLTKPFTPEQVHALLDEIFG